MDRPTRGELLEAVRRFIDQDLLPELEGVRRFHARVASNALAIVGRELELEGAQLPARHARLSRLLRRVEPAPQQRDALVAALDTLEAELAARIRAGEADVAPRRAEVLTHLLETVRERLAIANPDYR